MRIPQLLALALAALAGCANPLTHRTAVPFHKITDEVLASFSPAEQTISSLEHELNFKCVYQNVSKKDVQINTFVLGASSWALRITAPDGQELPPVPPSLYSEEQLARYVRILRPGETYSVDYKDVLFSYVGDIAPGEYKLEVKGIRSNPVRFRLMKGRTKTSNQSIQRMGASRFAQSPIEHHQRLAPSADAWR